MTRKYELRQRAERQAQTHQRIVEATVELHRTIGPARTTISAIAEQAGIERKTVYRHFPATDAIFEACSAHYRALHPPPHPDEWRAIDDPRERLRHGLLAAYSYYRENEPMMDNVLRDRELGVPVGEGFLRHRARAKAVLGEAFTISGARRRRLEAALELALDFRTWQTVSRNGLGDTDAADLLAALVDAAAQPRRPRRG